MKQFLFYLLISTSIFSQDFSSVKEKTDNYSGLLTAEKLANNINRDFSSDEDKVKAIFCWITKNIRYDLEDFYSPNRQNHYSFRYRTLEERDKKLRTLKDQIVTKTLSSRKGVCEGYAQTFAKICTLLNIKNDVINGYIRRSSNDINNPIAQPNHSWNAVQINSKWVFIDTTWAAGHEINGKWVRNFTPYYYDIKTKDYFKTHLPDESIWVLRVGRIEKEDFFNQPIYNHRFFNLDIELVSPTTGTLHKKGGKIELKLKNTKPTQQFHVGFLGMPFAQTPDVVKQNGITTISITPPNGARQAFFMIDKEVVLEFLIE